MMQMKFLTKNKLVAVEGGKTVGYVKFGHPNDDAGARNLEIIFVSVPPKHRRRGIASKMLTRLIDHYKNKVVWISLWTGLDTEKDGSWPLYEKLGFEQIAYQADYYEPGVGTRLFVRRFRKS